MGGSVTLIEPQAHRRALGLEIGARRAIDPTAGPLSEQVAAATSGRGFDVVIEAAGAPAAMASAFPIAALGARVVLVGIDVGGTVPVEIGLVQSKALQVRGIIGSAGMWPRTIRFMATSGVDPTPLLTATNNRHYKLAMFLIERGADVNRANKGGWTPLYLATDNRNIEGGDFPVPKPDMDHLEYIKFLLDRGATPNARIKDNTLTLTIFTMQWFFESGATPFVRAAQSSDIELMKVLLAHGADPKAATDHGDTALTAAAGIGWVEGVTYEHSAKANLETIKMLLDLGLDPNGTNRDGRAPLMGAAMKGRNEVVQFLVDHGAKLETRDKGSRDSEDVGSKIAGHTWQALDYADGLVRVGVQSAIARADTAALIRKLMTERGLPVPPPNRVVDSICVVEICKERVVK